MFEMDYLLYSLGRATELGYPAGTLLSWLGYFFTGIITAPGTNPYLIISNGRAVTVQIDGSYFPTFASLINGYLPSYQGVTSLYNTGPDDYSALATAGISYLTGQPNGQASWNFMRTNYPWSNFSTLPKWAVTPRGAVLPQASSCDLNSDGSVDAADVQSAINQALGTAACTGDLVGTRTCTVVDVQRVINAALGGVCRLGP